MNLLESRSGQGIQEESQLIKLLLTGDDQNKESDETISRTAAARESTDKALVSKNWNETIQEWNLSAERSVGNSTNDAIRTKVSNLSAQSRTELLHQSESKFLMLYENSPLPTSLMTWPGLQFETANSAWSELFEFSK